MKLLRIRFVIALNRANKNEKCPLSCRMTYQQKRKQFCTGISLNPKNWNSKKQLVETPEPDEDYINTQLSLIRQNLNQAFLFLHYFFKTDISKFIHDLYDIETLAGV